MLVVVAERVANEPRSCKTAKPLFLRSLINGLAEDRIGLLNLRPNFYFAGTKSINQS